MNIFSFLKKQSSLFYFSIFLIFLMALDFLTTNYALSHGSQEGNPFLTNVVNNPIIFLVIKFIGVMIIIMISKKCMQQNKKIAQIGQAIILLMMIIVVGNNIIVIGSALSISSFSGVVGSIGNGNGYFDNESSMFNLSQPQNIFVVTEPSSIWILEPLGYPVSISGASEIMRKGNNDLRFGMVASDGYLYYVDGDGIKMKVTRNCNIGAACDPLANDTGIGRPSVILYNSAQVRSMWEYNHNIYFIDLLNPSVLYYFNLIDWQISTQYNDLLGVVTVPYSSMAVYSNFGSITVFYDLHSNITGGDSKYNNVTGIHSPTPAQTVSQSSGGTFVTANYIFSTAGSEYIYYRSNMSLKSTNFYGTQGKAQSIGISQTVASGPYSTTVMYVSSATTYNVFNFIEPGVGTPYTPYFRPILNYETASVISKYPNYYNTSKIEIEYRLNFSVPYTAFVFDTFLGIPVGNPKLRYTYRIDMGQTGFPVLNSHPISDTAGLITCEVPGIDFLIYPEKQYNCHAANYYFLTPNPYWANGSYELNMFEITTGTGYTGLLSSDDFIVLNFSGGGVPGEGVPPGTYPGINGSDTWKPPNDDIKYNCGYFDGMVGLIGIGTNNPSRFLFALVIIIFTMGIGLLISKGDFGTGITLGFLPYAYFIYLTVNTPCGEYMPTWTVIFLAIMIALKMKWF